MDIEILDILKSIQSEIKVVSKRLDGVEGEIKVVSKRLDSVEGEIKVVSKRLDGVEGEIKVANQRLDCVEVKTDKNTILLENLNKNVEIVAEVQKSFREEIGRTKDEHGKSLSERLDVIELAVSDTSHRVKDIHIDLARVARNTGENLAEIIELKAVR